MVTKLWDPARLGNNQLRESSERRVGHRELFFDAMVVASMAPSLSKVVSDGFEYLASTHPWNENYVGKLDTLWGGLVLLVPYLACFCYIWLTEVRLNHQFDGGDDIVGRLLFVVLVFSVCAMSGAAYYWDLEDGISSFATAFFVAMVVHIFTLVRNCVHLPKSDAKLFIPQLAADVLGCIFLISSMIETSAVALKVTMLYLAPLVSCSTLFSMTKSRKASPPVNPFYYPGRFSTIITFLFAEMMWSVLQSNIATLQMVLFECDRSGPACDSIHPSYHSIWIFVTVTVWLWWIYYDTVGKEVPANALANSAWTVSHMALVLALIVFRACLNVHAPGYFGGASYKDLPLGVTAFTFVSVTLAVASIAVISFLTTESGTVPVQSGSRLCRVKPIIRLAINIASALILFTVAGVQWNTLGVAICLLVWLCLRSVVDFVFFADRAWCEYKSCKSGLGATRTGRLSDDQGPVGTGENEAYSSMGLPARRSEKLETDV